jgi:hypothetical protein
MLRNKKIYISVFIFCIAISSIVNAQVEIVSTGTGASYLVNAPAVFPLRNGIQITFKAHTTCFASATINVSGTGALPITKEGGTNNLSAGDIQAGQVVTIAYDGANWQMLSSLGNSAAGLSGSGTEDYVSKWNNAAGTTLGNSSIFDNGSIGIFTNTPAGDFHLFRNNGPRIILDADGGNASAATMLDFTTGGNAGSGSFVGSVTGWQLRSLSSAFGNTALQNDLQLRYYNGFVFVNAMHFDNSGNIGFGTVVPDTKVDIAGDLSTRESVSSTTTNPISDAAISASTSFITMNGQTADYSFTGIANGYDGKFLTIYNSTPFKMTLEHEHAGSMAQNRIVTGLTAALTVGPDASVSLIYSANKQRWIVKGWSNVPDGTSLAGGGINNYVARWTPTGTQLGTGVLYDNGANVGVDHASPASKLTVNGGVSIGASNVNTTAPANGLLVEGKVNIGNGAVGNDMLHVYKPTTFGGPNSSGINVERVGFSGIPNGGNDWTVNGVDAGIKAYSYWGNNYSASIIGYNYISDYENSAGVIGANQSASIFGALGYRGTGTDQWAGWFQGNTNTTGNIDWAGALRPNGNPGANNEVLVSTGGGSNMWVNVNSLIAGGNYIENQNGFDQGATFRINGDGLFNGGRIGINTLSPAYPLHVNSTVGLTAAQFGSSDPLFVIAGGGDGLGFNTFFNGGYRAGSAGYSAAIIQSPGTGKIDFMVSPSSVGAGSAVTLGTAMSINSLSNVMIGSSSDAASQLEVYKNNSNATGTDGTFASITNWDGGIGTMSGLRFKATNVINNNSFKAGILFQSTASNGRGDMIFALNNVASTSNITTGDEKMRITAAGFVGIGNSNPASALDVTGQMYSRSFNVGASTSINWNNSNTQLTTANPTAFTFTNLQDGGSYTLFTTSATSGTNTFSQAGLTFIFTPPNGPTTTATVTQYKFNRIGTNVYVEWQTIGSTPSLLSGGGTANFAARWVNPTQLGTGLIYDNNSVVGIGTGATPSASRLHVHSTSGNGNFRMTSASTGQSSTDGFVMTNDGSTAISMSQQENADWYFGSNSLVAMTIKPNSYISVGGINASNRLVVEDQANDVMRITRDNTAGATHIAKLVFSNRYAGGENVLARIGIADGGTNAGVLTFETKTNTNFPDATTTEKMRILANGNVGIGTISPSTILHVSGAAAQSIRITSTSNLNAAIELAGSSPQWRMIGGPNAGDLNIQSSTDNFATNTDRFRFWTSYFIPGTDNSMNLGGGSNRWTSVWATNGVIQTSDKREKENIMPLNYGLKEIMALRPVSYNWISSYSDRSKKMGLIAQEVLPIIKEAVYNPKDTEPEFLTAPDGTKKVNPNYVDRYGVNYSELVPVLIKAIQEQQEKIIMLEKKVESLEKK